MIAEQPKLIRQTLLTYFLLVLAIQAVHLIIEIPVYDLTYILIITLFLTLGELSPRFRGICYGFGFFLMDLWPDWFIMVMAIFPLALRKITPITSLNLKNYRKSEPKITAKIGI